MVFALLLFAFSSYFSVDGYSAFWNCDVEDVVPHSLCLSERLDLLSTCLSNLTVEVLQEDGLAIPKHVCRYFDGWEDNYDKEMSVAYKDLFQNNDLNSIEVLSALYRQILFIENNKFRHAEVVGRIKEASYASNIDLDKCKGRLFQLLSTSLLPAVYVEKYTLLYSTLEHAINKKRGNNDHVQIMYEPPVSRTQLSFPTDDRFFGTRINNEEEILPEGTKRQKLCLERLEKYQPYEAGQSREVYIKSLLQIIEDTMSLSLIEQECVEGMKKELLPYVQQDTILSDNIYVLGPILKTRLVMYRQHTFYITELMRHVQELVANPSAHNTLFFVEHTEEARISQDSEDRYKKIASVIRGLVQNLME